MARTGLRSLVLAVLVAVALAASQTTAYATHSWGPYHWARTANPFLIQLGDNASAGWDAYLGTTSRDWSKSKVLDTTIVSGGTNPQSCRATLGRVEVCTWTYGQNGWLGIATIWISGPHIVQGTARMNDSYFNMARFNTTAWKNLVMCQEVGHTFGLDHQDEDFYNEPLGTCMDYSADPEPNQHPNRHDYQQLAIIYDHLDAFTTVGAMPAGMAQLDTTSARAWGRLVRTSRDGSSSVYERDFGGGFRTITFVIWAR